MKDYLSAMNDIDKSIIEKASKIKLLILDVDGVLTDGGIYVSENGAESKKFLAQDGHGLAILKTLNVELAVISGRYSKAVEHRCEELGFKKIIQNSRDKYSDFKEIFSKHYKTADVCFVGDDVVDIELMKNVGLAITVPNANYNDVKKNSHWVTPRLGGHGAVRDVCDLIYLAKKHESK